MPAKLNNKLKRLYLIVKTLKQKNQSKQKLINLLAEHGLDIETATFERDKKTLKDDFGIELVYEGHDKTYTLDMPNSEQLAMVIQFFQFHQLSTTINESLSDKKSSLDYIDFENEYQLQGIEYLDRLLYATKIHLLIRFKHRRFETPTVKDYTLKPYLLKQYQSRWYVYGETKKHEFKLFGVDRIERLEILNKKFKAKSLDLKQKFKQLVGVSGSYLKPQYVQLAFDNSQYEYLEQLPLHHSQSIVELNENQVIYGYIVVINFELKQQILKYGSLVKVIQPKSLAEEIQDELSKALLNYTA